MKLLKISLFVFTSIFSASLCPATAGEEKPIPFGGVSYLPRWAEKNQHEFTPKGQEDLEHWNDMITIVTYPQVKDGDGLATMANTVLGLYKDNGAEVVKTASKPRTEEKAAEHIIIVFFQRPELVEAVFARFVIVDKTAIAFIYSHREYGQDAGNLMKAWQKKNGGATENLLIKQTDFSFVGGQQDLRSKLF